MVYLSTVFLQSKTANECIRDARAEGIGKSGGDYSKCFDINPKESQIIHNIICEKKSILSVLITSEGQKSWDTMNFACSHGFS